MGLSSDPLSSMVVQDYKNLTRSTSEGNYVNIVDVEKADILAAQFLSSTDIYPSNNMPIIQEFFQTI